MSHEMILFIPLLSAFLAGEAVDSASSLLFLFMFLSRATCFMLDSSGLIPVGHTQS